MREQGQERGSAWGQAGRFGLERLRRGCRQWLQAASRA